MTTAATDERHLFAELLASVGPDAPTLCGDWTTRDLAAHIVIRDRRPDALPGIVTPKLAGYTDKVQHVVTERTDYAALVRQVAEGPKFWSPTRIDAVDRAVNTFEFFVHHEDVRRAEPGWEPRVLVDELDHDLYGSLRRGARALVRNAPCGIVLCPDDGRAEIVAHKGEPAVKVRGPIGELVLWSFGRQAHSRVDYEGDPAAIAELASARFGV